MKYRELLDLTDDEIKYILTEIFHPVSIGEIRRDYTWNEIVVEMTTGGWNDGDEEDFDIEDEVTLKMPTAYSCGLEVDFSLSKDDIFRYQQFLLAMGCDYRLKDNPYLAS